MTKPPKTEKPAVLADFTGWRKEELEASWGGRWGGGNGGERGF